VKLVQFGAGSIGRSFIGQLFSRGGWEVVFIDIDDRVIDALNRRREYRVEIKDKTCEAVTVKNVRGVSARDEESVAAEVSGADLVSTAVGKGALPHIMKHIAGGLIRRKEGSEGPLDIIICENMRDAAGFFRRSLESLLPPGFPLDEYAGFVETSIGKMVPIMDEELRSRDPLLVYAEAYNTLIVDGKGFRNFIPAVEGIDAQDNIKAYVDRKLFIHNLGHAVLSYVSFAFRPDYRFVWQAAEDTGIEEITRRSMWESGKGLIGEYPADFDSESIGEHIEDLLSRFKNRALGDTVYRAGRDLYRKLAPDDRLLGAAFLCLKHSVDPKAISLGVGSALFFKAVDNGGALFERDRVFHEREMSRGPSHVLRSICGLQEGGLFSGIMEYYRRIEGGERKLSGFK